MSYIMKLLIVGLSCTLTGVFFVTGWAVYPPPEGAAQAMTAMQDEVIVKFKAGVPPANMQAAHAKVQAVPKQTIARLGAQVVRLPARKSLAELQAIVQEYRKDPTVEYAEVNGIVTIQEQKGPITGRPLVKRCPQTNDPRFGELWGIIKIKADCAWTTQVGAIGMTVAVVDTGVDATHEDFTAKLIVGQPGLKQLPPVIVKGYDFYNNDADPTDDNGHGTHVAGTIAAIINNTKGVVGIAPNVRILAVKVLGAGGSGTFAQVASGVVYAADQGARVINLSLGSPVPSQTIRDAVDYAWGKGLLVACAAGNNGPIPPGYPAAYPNCLAVAATDQNDQRPSFSQHAPEGVAAPGVQILSTSPGNQYRLLSGTSMATPHVAGLAGLLFSQNPNRTNARVRDMIQTGTDDMGSPGKDPIFGFGRINVDKAVKLCGTGPNLSC